MSSSVVSSLYHVALMGFSGFEQVALDACLELARTRNPAYAPCAGIEDAQFVVANGDRSGVLELLATAQRMGDTVLVGAAGPSSVAARLSRPIDPTELFRLLDEVVQRRSLATTAARTAPHRVTMAELAADWPQETQPQRAALRPSLAERATGLFAGVRLPSDGASGHGRSKARTALGRIVRAADIRAADLRARGLLEPIAADVVEPGRPNLDGYAPPGPTEPPAKGGSGAPPSLRSPVQEAIVREVVPAAVETEALMPAVQAPVAFAPIALAPVVLAPLDPAPVDPAPSDLAPTALAPVDPTPVDPTPVGLALVDPTPVDPAPVDPAPVDLAPAALAPADVVPHPLVQPVVPDVAFSAIADAVAPSTHARTLAALVIDPSGGTDLAPALELQNVDATCVTRLHHAFAMLDAVYFDLIAIDVGFSPRDELDGLQICHALRRRPRQPGDACPPIFMMSARPSPLEQARAALAGCRGYVARPLDEHALAKALADAGLRPEAAPPGIEEPRD